MSNVETIAFTMHPQLLYSVIQRQAGTLSKAILEGVMNGVDARAKSIDITVTPTTIRIVDDGKGFKSREEIDLFFRTFGQPHEEAEQKIYGAFRMGRGQLFAFGKNHWLTGTFEMHVDIKNKGLDFGLVTNKKKAAGCTIDIVLYEPLLPSEIVTVERDLERMVRYVSVPVTLNGSAISKDPAKSKWDFETDDAYIRLKPTGGLAVYNLGVFVHEISSYHLGTGGEVVAKKQLKVNFARNDVQADCPVWKRVKKVVDQNAKDANVRKPQLDEGARQRLAFQWVNEPKMRHELRKSPLFTDTQGRNWSVARMGNFFGRGAAASNLLTVTGTGDQRADKLMQQKRAFVLSHDTLERFGVPSAAKLLELLQGTERWSEFEDWKVVEFNTLAKELSTNYALLPEKDWKPLEKVVIKLLENSQYNWTRLLPGQDPDDWQGAAETRRVFYVGISDAAEAWTDGTTYVAMNRELLAQAGTTLEGMLRLAQVVIHEFTHEKATTAAHLHTPEFYHNYHDSMEATRVLVEHLWMGLPKALEALGKRLNKRQLRERDREARTTRAATKVRVALAK